MDRKSFSALHQIHRTEETVATAITTTATICGNIQAKVMVHIHASHNTTVHNICYVHSIESSDDGF